MNNKISTAPVYKLKELNNTFIELTAKNCNTHCSNCYINFSASRCVKDFIPVDKIKEALEDTKSEKLYCIYLTGAEPMTHPDFNAILRLCLKRSNVCICTNGSFINEKKARFLKKVEDESSNEIIFKISMNHWDEVKNDEVRYHGAFRQALFAIKHLVKYNFNPIIAFTNYYNLSANDIRQGFAEVFSRNSLDLDNSNIQISPWHDASSFAESSETGVDCISPDCKYGRILTSTGVYTCPFLANDYRGRCGSSFQDYNKRSSLETSFCNTCIKSGKPVFSIDFSQFE